MASRVGWFLLLLEALIWNAIIIIPRGAESLPQEVIFPDQLQHRPRPPTQQIFPKSGACSGKELVSPRNQQPGNGAGGCDLLQGDVMWPGDNLRCAKLLSQGPCNPGFWVTLSNNIAEESICSPRHCSHEEVVMGGQCYKVNDRTMCPPTMTLQANLFGMGECDCPTGTIYYKFTNMCYTPYTQGPCQHGEIIKVMDFDDRGESRCVRNPCTSENMVPLDAQCNVADRTSLTTGTSQCHTINTAGPCSSGVLSIDRSLAEPGCADDSDRNLFDGIPCRRGSRLDQRSGRCRMIFNRRPMIQNQRQRRPCRANELDLGGRCVPQG